MRRISNYIISIAIYTYKIGTRIFMGHGNILVYQNDTYTDNYVDMKH